MNKPHAAVLCRSPIIVLLLVTGCIFEKDRREEEKDIPSYPKIVAFPLSGAPASDEPFTDEPFTIPGKIEAEQFNTGRDGDAYHNTSPGNAGHTDAFRATDVDIEKSHTASEGYRVIDMEATEWLSYSVDVKSAGTYTVQVSADTRGKGGTFHIEFGGVDRTGPIRVADAEDATIHITFQKPGVRLPAGRQKMKVVMDQNGTAGVVADIDYFRFIDEREPPGRRTNTVEVRIIDSETGGTTPCMVCIRSVDDGSVRLPPDGRVQTKTSNFFDLENGTDFDPADRNWVGPVFQMFGRRANEYGDDMYDHELNSLPYWNEPVIYQTTGNFSIRLPDGQWRMSVTHGMEFVPVVEEFETGGGGTMQKRIEMKRWIDLAEQGWYSGDTHVHHPTTKERDRQYLLEYCIAEDLHVCNMMEWTHHYRWMGDGSKSLFPVSGFGEQFRASKGEFWLVSGQEDSNCFG